MSTTILPPAGVDPSPRSGTSTVAGDGRVAQPRRRMSRSTCGELVMMPSTSQLIARRMS